MKQEFPQSILDGFPEIPYYLEDFREIHGIHIDHIDMFLRFIHDKYPDIGKINLYKKNLKEKIQHMEIHLLS